MNSPDVIVTDEWRPGYQKITAEPIGWYAKERELARNAVEVQSKAGPIRMKGDDTVAGGVTLYLKGEPIYMADWEMQPWMIPFLVPPKPRTLWQRFLGRIGL